jgi:YHS domain-containing protein
MLVRFVLELVLIIVVARAFWRLVDGIMVGLSGRPPRPNVPQRGVQMVRDPVCGTFVVPDTALMIADGSRRLYFCSSRCRDQYRARTA